MVFHVLVKKVFCFYKIECFTNILHFFCCCYFLCFILDGLWLLCLGAQLYTTLCQDTKLKKWKKQVLNVLYMFGTVAKETGIGITFKVFPGTLYTSFV